MKTKPIKCPFCGCIPEITERCHNYYKKRYFITVSCLSDRCMVNPETHGINHKGKWIETKEEAIEIWNNALEKHHGKS